MAKWMCKVCGYIHEGDTPPDECPLCGAPGTQFEKVP
jgi:rubrerythrin